jgi:hypothetical protein
MSTEMAETAPASIALNVSSASSVATGITIDFVTADSIGISYTTIPGNQPNTYGNFIALWQNSDPSIPWNTAPLATYAVPTNTPNGAFVFTGLNVTTLSYVIGFSVGPVLSGNAQKNGNICASAFIPGSNSPTPSVFNPTLTLVYDGPYALAVGYALPNGILPQSNGAWIGLWRNGSPSYTQAPDSVAQVTLNAPNGTVAMNNIILGRGNTYTVGFFTSGYKGTMGNAQTAIASYVTFTV